MHKGRNFKLLIGGAASAFLLLSFGSVSASSANISRSYSSSTAISNGSLVSLDPSHTSSVVPANTDNGKRLVGVALASTDSLLAVDTNAGTIQVATSGTVNTFVSTLNGPIAVGDEISVSPYNGIGMKAITGGNIIGLAQTAFTDKTAGAASQTVTDKDGKSAQIWVGYIRLGIGIGTATTQGATSQKLNGLQQFVKSLTGHTISTLRIITSLVVLMAAIIAFITLIYASIYGSIISIGRNPLAKFSVFRSLRSVMAMILLMTVIAGATIFLLLR